MLAWLGLALGAYLFGSIPFAYLLVSMFSGKDIRNEGTGNVGAMNAFDVTGSKALGIAVMILDAFKGVVAVLAAKDLFDANDYAMQLATLSATLGHCYPIWLKFRGGRGLATAAGATLMFVPSVFVAWCVVWSLAWLYSKRLHFCNISATISLLLIEPIFLPVNFYPFLVLLVGLVLLRHRDVMKTAFKGG
ncbi:MAG: glycerol-3-phosphate acyltransferase [Chloroherpetonaceae bacterium]|nr:glycerol-3-phosphate acyltransferase [Chloroherpetonaceae bacterium]MDW8438501.1 glycerol-3-phosphate acyltransferase [Chloroherpetonaceae bacterium]